MVLHNKNPNLDHLFRCFNYLRHLSCHHLYVIRHIILILLCILPFNSFNKTIKLLRIFIKTEKTRLNQLRPTEIHVPSTFLVEPTELNFSVVNNSLHQSKHIMRMSRRITIITSCIMHHKHSEEDYTKNDVKHFF